MFRKSMRWTAVMALPAVATIGGLPAWSQDLGPVPAPALNPSMLNAACIDMFNSGQQPRLQLESRRDNAARDPVTYELLRNPDDTPVRAATVTEITTASGGHVFPENPDYPNGDSFSPNPSNLLPTVYENSRSCRGNEIPNTLPSTPDNPYNLHDDPVIRTIDKTSPTDDLDWILDQIEAMSEPRRICRSTPRFSFCYEIPARVNTGQLRQLARHAVDIIEGNTLRGELRGREYEGFPLLNYLGGLKTKSVDPVTKTVEINQLWFDTHVLSDTAYVDPTVVNDEEWTIKYNVKILNRGHEDFAPFTMFYEDPSELNLSDIGGPDLTMGGTVVPRVANVGMDQTFFPMEEGQEYTLNMKMPPARFWNLSYHWGWRIHPPRVQVTENVLAPLADGRPRNAEEIRVFGENPRQNQKTKLNAIAQIGDTAPAKRMWRMFSELGGVNGQRPSFGLINGSSVRARAELIRQAFEDWQNRNRLPTGYEMDPDYDLTVVYLNNRMYGQLKDHDGRAEVRMKDEQWSKRGDQLKIKLLNGDYFLHTYVLVDFGGLRGWENTFHNTLPVGGAGPLFTFGRVHWWVHTAGSGPVAVPPAQRPSASVGPLASRATGNSAVVNAKANAVLAKGNAGQAKGNAQAKGAASLFRGQAGNPQGPGPHQFGAWGGLMIPTADYVNTDGVGEHDVIVNFTYEPSRRLRIYQFDALHHDQAVWSVH
jgi:hypothetical protein